MPLFCRQTIHTCGASDLLCSDVTQHVAHAKELREDQRATQQALEAETLLLRTSVHGGRVVGLAGRPNCVRQRHLHEAIVTMH